MNINLTNGSRLPVDPKFNPVCGFDSEGNPMSLAFISDGLKVSVGASTLPEGAASEATLSDQRTKSFGLNGGRYVTTTTAQSGTFFAIQALEDTVLASMTATDLSGTLTSVPIPAGAIIYGVITAFTLTSGKVVAYNA